jgi:hypothetical protein
MSPNVNYPLLAKIPALNNTNFDEWRRDVRVALQLHGVWRDVIFDDDRLELPPWMRATRGAMGRRSPATRTILSGVRPSIVSDAISVGYDNDPAPGDGSDNDEEVAIPLEPEGGDTRRASPENPSMKVVNVNVDHDERAKAIILTCAGKDMRPRLDGYESANCMWFAIGQWASHQDINKLEPLIRQLNSLQKKESESVAAFFDRVRDLCIRLFRLKFTVEESSAIHHALGGLHEVAYLHVKTLAVELRNSPTLTFDFVLEKLQHAEVVLEGIKASKKQVDALAAASSKAAAPPPPPPPKSGGARQKRAPCKHCGKDTHPDARCWKKFPEQRPPEFAFKGKVEALEKQIKALTAQLGRVGEDY